MATCEITTFETHLSPSRNALVDDIQTYLHTDCTQRYHNAQFGFLKMALDMELILPLGQDDVMQNEFGNYAEIIQSDRIWYYFITACEWTSQNAVKVKLSIDSINTFREDLEWSPQTTIEREHLDRMFLGNDNRVYRYIDPEPENIPTVKHIEQKTKLLQNNQDLNWYLIYDTPNPQTSNSVIRCRCIADQALVISKTGGGAGRALLPSDLPTGQYNYVIGDDNPSFEIIWRRYNRILKVGATSSTTVENATITQGGEFMIPYYTYTQVMGHTAVASATEKIYRVKDLRFVSDGNVLSLEVVGEFLRDGTVHNGNPVLGQWTPDFTGYCQPTENTATTGEAIWLNELGFTRTTYDGNIPIEYAQQLINETQVYNIGTYVTRSTIPFSQLTRTETTLVKIINLPYAPCTVTYDADTGVYTFPDDWVYESGYMRLNDANLNAEFGATVTNINLTDVLVNTFDTNNARNVTDVRRDWRESKMFGSQFSTYKLVYDSFSLEVPLENIYYYDIDAIGVEGADVPITFNITFKPSNTMNSHFAFYADLDSMINENPNLWDGANYRHHGDYDEYVITTRNNEESIFSSAYLDYIRNGYNYDKKVKADQATMSYLMGGLQVVGSVISFAASTITGGVSVAAGVALATSAIATFASAAHNDAAAGEKINQKLKELALQGANVSSGDDVDLLKFYSGNKALWIRYVTDAYQYYPLLDLFHYCGYKHPRHEVPNVTSRYWFNFIQCAPIFSNEGQFVWQNYLDDIRARYRAGVTVYHRHPGKLTDTAYDWDQTHENWENSLLTGEIDAEVEVNHTQYYDEYIITGQITNRKNGDVVDFEWYSDAQSWADKDPDDTTNVTVNADGSFAEDDNMQNGIAIRARVRNTISGKTYSWHTIWEAE